MDVFTTAYIQAALWSSTDNSRPDGGDPLDKNYTKDAISTETLQRMKDDCKDFQAKYKELYENDDIDGMAGIDFWLTRNRHGAGFWDGDWTNGDALTEAAHSYGSYDLYVGDNGQIFGG